MRSIGTILLRNALSAIVDHVEQIPDLEPDLPGLIEFKEIVIKRIQELQREDHLRFPGADCEAA
jgi:hypothetical protein